MAGIVLANNVFAAETQIEVNGLTVTVNRELGVDLEKLGEGAEAYGITIDDRLIGEALTLENLRFDFGTDNYLSISENKTISAKYNTFSKSFTVSSATETCIDVTNDGVNDICIEIGGANNIYFAASKSLSDSFFGNVFKNHAPFTFSAESESKKIDVKRENSGGRDKYTLTSNSEINSASIIDGTDKIAITKNGNGYNVSGQYKGNSGSTSISLGGEGVIEYGNIKIGMKVDDKTIILDADPSVVEAIAQKLIDEKRNIKEITVKNGVPYEIPSNGSLETIKIEKGTANPEVRFTLSSDGKAEINKELTIDSQNTGMQIVFPGGTKISGLNTDGIMALPKVTSVSIPAKEGFAISQLFTIEIGDGSLTFDKPAKLVFPGMAKKKVGFKIGDGEFKEITSDCGNESPALNPNSECKFDRGNDLLVFTNHFTKFAVYSESAISTGGGGGGSAVQYLNISNVNVNLKNDEASITFNVNRPASIVLKYGLGEGVYTNEIKETQLKTSHSFNLINLKESKYYYKIEARDKEGSSASYSQSFTLSGVPAINEINNAANMETSTKVKDQKTYNYNGVITTKPLNEMSKDELFRLFLILLLKSLLAQKGITL